MDNREKLKEALKHIYWIGGSPCSGKSSIADVLVERYGMTLYRCDDAFWRHDKMTTPEHQPVFYRVMRLTPEALWMRPVKQQTAEEIEIYREEFAMILDDLLALPRDRPVLAEGAALMPELVAPLIDDPRRAIWVVPTAEFQWAYYRRREFWREVVKDCSDPEQAFRNWMERDAAFAHIVAQDAEARGLRVLVVDGQRSLSENTATVDSYLRPSSFS